MNNDEGRVFEKVLDALDAPEPDHALKDTIMKGVYFLMVAKEIGAFHASIPQILLNDTTEE